MNKADLVYAICHLVGLKPEKAAGAAGGGGVMSPLRA
jgi:hypothetical protein